MEDFSEKISSLLSDPDSLERIKTIAGSLMGNSSKKDDDISSQEKEAEKKDEFTKPKDDMSDLISSFLGSQTGIDSNLISRLINAYTGTGAISEDKIALLHALKPHLSAERGSKIDTAVNMLRLSKMALAFFNEGEE